MPFKDKATRREYNRRYHAVPEHKLARRLSRQRNPDTQRAAKKRHRARHPSQDIDRYRKRVYGVTSEQFEAAFEAQGRRCALCPSTTSRSKYGWCCDHDHDTRAFRGILCHPCNLLLGHYEKHKHRHADFEAYLGPRA